jgi:hypothetical protein
LLRRAPDVTPAKVEITRELTNDGRALAPRFTSPSPWASLPTHSRSPTPRRTHAAQACKSSGALPTQSHAASAPRASHQFPQTGLLERRSPATISFTSPKLTRKPSPPGPSHEVTVRDHHLLPGGPSVIQANKAQTALRPRAPNDTLVERRPRATAEPVVANDGLELPVAFHPALIPDRLGCLPDHAVRSEDQVAVE